jgi:hypothetical protein
MDERFELSVKDFRWPDWVGRLGIAAGIAMVVVALALFLIVWWSRSAWLLLGAGRGVIPEEYFYLSGFAIVAATTVGQVVGWAGGSAALIYGLTLVRVPVTWTTVRLAMSVVYLGLAVLPLSVYHLLFGQWLLGMPRTGLGEWLAGTYPDAHWLLIRAHPVVDFSLVPLAVVFLGVMWGFGERVQGSALLQTVLALALLGTSAAVALSLGIHSTLIHIRL